jgi:hypothetical protein
MLEGSKQPQSLTPTGDDTGRQDICVAHDRSRLNALQHTHGALELRAAVRALEASYDCFPGRLPSKQLHEARVQ